MNQPLVKHSGWGGAPEITILLYKSTFALHQPKCSDKIIFRFALNLCWTLDPLHYTGVSVQKTDRQSHQILSFQLPLSVV